MKKTIFLCLFICIAPQSFAYFFSKKVKIPVEAQTIPQLNPIAQLNPIEVEEIPQLEEFLNFMKTYINSSTMNKIADGALDSVHRHQLIQKFLRHPSAQNPEYQNSLKLDLKRIENEIAQGLEAFIQRFKQMANWEEQPDQYFEDTYRTLNHFLKKDGVSLPFYLERRFANEILRPNHAPEIGIEMQVLREPKSPNTQQDAYEMKKEKPNHWWKTIFKKESKPKNNMPMPEITEPAASAMIEPAASAMIEEPDVYEIKKAKPKHWWETIFKKESKQKNNMPMPEITEPASAMIEEPEYDNWDDRDEF